MILFVTALAMAHVPMEPCVKSLTVTNVTNVTSVTSVTYVYPCDQCDLCTSGSLDDVLITI